MVQAQPADADDPTGGYMLQAGARICKSLGEEFLPYLGIVMPPLLHSAQLKPDVRVTEADSDDDEDDNDEDVRCLPPAKFMHVMHCVTRLCVPEMSLCDGSDMAVICLQCACGKH